jgi:hypothetical protein
METPSTVLFFINTSSVAKKNPIKMKKTRKITYKNKKTLFYASSMVIHTPHSNL